MAEKSFIQGEPEKPNCNGELDKDGDRAWTDSEGKWHREGGPALEYINSSGIKTGEDWFRHGQLFREDGPAVDYYDRRESEWHYGGEEHTKKEWLQWLKDGKSSLDQKTVLRLILENS
jgi:hypothetical protein